MVVRFSTAQMCQVLLVRIYDGVRVRCGPCHNVPKTYQSFSCILKYKLTSRNRNARMGMLFIIHSDWQRLRKSIYAVKSSATKCVLYVCAAVTFGENDSCVEAKSVFMDMLATKRASPSIRR